MPRELRTTVVHDDERVVGVAFKGVQKRRVGGKHYVYVIVVSFKYKDAHTIYRRYSQFSALHDKLVDLTQRVGSPVASEAIPPLPSKLVVGRSHLRSVAEGRVGALETFLSTVLELDDHVAVCKDVTKFLELTSEDYHTDQGGDGAADKAGDSDDDGATSPSSSQAMSPVPRARSRSPRSPKPARAPPPRNQKKTKFPRPLRKQPSEPTVVCHYKGETKKQVIPEEDADVIFNPSFKELSTFVKGLVSDWSIVLNYVDEDGDLVAVGDAEDLAVYLSTRPFTNLLELCITAKGDYASYSTGLPR